MVLIAAAMAIGAAVDIAKSIYSANAKEEQLRANDNALRIAEEHNSLMAQQQRLAVMGGAFSGGTYNSYISQQLHFSNADLVARRRNIAIQQSATRFNEVATIVGSAAKAALSYGKYMSSVNNAAANLASLNHIGGDLSTISKEVEPLSSRIESTIKGFGVETDSLIDKAGSSMDSYLSKVGDFAEESMSALGAAGVALGGAV